MTRKSYIRNILGIAMTFCMVMLFHIGARPLTSGMLAAAVGMLWFCTERRFGLLVADVGRNSYVMSLLGGFLLLGALAIAAQLVHDSGDPGPLTTIAGATLNMLCCAVAVTFLHRRLGASASDFARWMSAAFILQSLIVLIVLAFPAKLLPLMSFFTMENPDGRSWFRFTLMSGGVIWGASISFGLMYIIGAWRLPEVPQKYDPLVVLAVGLLAVGALVAGRIALAGLLIALLWLPFRIPLKRYFRLLLMLAVLGALALAAVMLIFPESEVVNKITHWASTSFMGGYDSLGELSGMWRNTDFTSRELMEGTGLWNTPNGGNFRGIDPGPLRLITFWGLAGYVDVVLLQLLTLTPLLLCRRTRTFAIVALIFLIVCEMKGVALGIAKMPFSMIFPYAYLLTLNNPEPCATPTN